MKQTHDERETELERRINALLDGELDDAEAERLRAEAGADQEIARAIIDAYQLQRAMQGLRVERAPASLRRRLRRIPNAERPAWRQPRWAAAFAMVPVALLSAVLVQQARQPSEADVERAAQELAMAFAYIDRVGRQAGREVDHRLERELRSGVTKPLIDSVPGLNPVPEEEQA